MFFSTALGAEPALSLEMDLSLKTGPWEASSITLMLLLGK